MSADRQPHLAPVGPQHAAGAAQDVDRLGAVEAVVLVDAGHRPHQASTSASVRRRLGATASAAPAPAPRGSARSSASSSACVPVGDDPAVVEQHDPVGEGDRRRPVGDDDRRPAAHHLGERVADLVLLRRVDRGGGVVEDEHAGVGEDRPGDGDALALAARQREAALADDGARSRRAARRRSRGRRRVGRPARSARRRRRDRRRRCWRRPCRRRGTSPRSTMPTARRRSCRRERRARRRRRGGWRRRRRRRSGGAAGRRSILPEPVGADEGDRLARLDDEVEPVEHRRAVARVARSARRRTRPRRTARRPAAAAASAAAGRRSRARRRAPRGPAARRRRPAAAWARIMPSIRSGQIEHDHVDVEGDERADRQPPVEHGVAAVAERRHEADGREQLEARPVRGADHRRPHRRVVDVVGLDARSAGAGTSSAPKPFTTRTPDTDSSTTRGQLGGLRLDGQRPRGGAACRSGGRRR